MPALTTVPELRTLPAVAPTLLVKAAAAATSTSVTTKLLVTLPPDTVVLPRTSPPALLVKLPPVFCSVPTRPAFDAVPALFRVESVAPPLLVKVPPEATEAPVIVPLLESEVPFPTTASRSVPFTVTLPF